MKHTEATILTPSSQHPDDLAREYNRIEQLVDHAAHGLITPQYTGQNILYVDPETLQITNATPTAIDLLGYSKADLLSRQISEIELRDETSDSSVKTFVETSIVEHIYPAAYRHYMGHTVQVLVSKRLLDSKERNLLVYRLEDKSLYARLAYELTRREDVTFSFQQKLRALNEITIELSRIDSYEELCQQIIKAATERLGIDRIAMWFLDVDRGVMVGSYGIDERGNLRAEHQQSWQYHESYIMDFVTGQTETSIAMDDAPIYNDKSQIIEHGWHISAPIRHANQLIGVLTADNYLNKQPMKSYEPELLRLYGLTVGHLTELSHARDRAFTMRLEQERFRMLRQFIQSVGHDFRTPLSIISTKSYLLKRAEQADLRQSLDRDINEQVAYISKMLNRILEFTDMEFEVVLNLVQLNIATLMANLIETHRTSIDAKHLQVDLTLSTIPTIRGDESYLSIALNELIENAVQYSSDSGQIQIDIVEASDSVAIRIKDNGVGIDSTIIDKIFTPMYRVNEARTEHRSGLGLSIAKTIIDAHQGRIVVESSPGQGSTFEVILPRQVSSDAQTT